MAISITDKRRVALAYDGSEDAHKLFDWTIQNVIRPESDHLILLSAVQRTNKPQTAKRSPSPDLPMLSTTITKVDEAIKETEHQPTARERLEQMSSQLRKQNISSEEHILWGDPRVLLPRYTQAHKVDLLVVGSRGLGVVKSVILGSVSDACLKECPCPVLVVRHATI
ncbi:hypothetical protein RMATCC62417_04061 [Rhizopus microsporus]|nr:hypothetical protein RMATCC62417_04061 [Rhizopus microsporus]